MPASDSLTGNNPAATYAQLLHIGTGTASVSVIRTGTGTATALELVTGGVKVNGGLTVTSGVSASTLSVSGPAAVASLTVNGSPYKAPTWTRLTANVVATDTTNVALTPLSFTPETGAVYEVEMMLIITSAATTGGAQIQNTGGAGTLYLLEPSAALGITATGGSYLLTTSPVAGTWALLLKGIFIASSTASLTFSLRSDDTNDVTALTGSYLRMTKIS